MNLILVLLLRPSLTSELGCLQNHSNFQLTCAKNKSIPQARYSIPPIHILIVLTSDHIRKMLQARIMRQRDLCPTSAPSTALPLHYSYKHFTYLFPFLATI